jgi:hypothetical protein
VRELADSDPLLKRGAEFRKDDLEKTLRTEFKNRGSVNQLHENSVQLKLPSGLA